MRRFSSDVEEVLSAVSPNLPNTRGDSHLLSNHVSDSTPQFQAVDYE